MGRDRNLEAATVIHYLGISDNPEKWSEDDQRLFSGQFILGIHC